MVHVEGKNIVEVSSMEEAITQAYTVSNKGVLLSPASPSFNLFKSYVDKKQSIQRMG